jgi:hypothetical protein
MLSRETSAGGTTASAPASCSITFLVSLPLSKPSSRTRSGMTRSANLREPFHLVNVIWEIQKNDLAGREIPGHLHESDAASRTPDIRARYGVPFNRGDECRKDTAGHKGD